MLRRVLLVALLAGGCAGDGCGCVQAIPGGFPYDQREPNAVQVRLSQTGVSALSTYADDVIRALFPGGLNFSVPSVCSNPSICCGAPVGWCQIRMDTDQRPGDPPRVEVAPRDGQGRAGLTLRTRVRTEPRPLEVEYEVTVIFTITVGCDVHLNTEWDGADSITARTELEFTQDPTTGTTRIGFGAVSLQDLDSGDIDIDGNIACELADLFKGFFVDQVKSSLEEQASGAIEDLLCKGCDSDDDCGGAAFCSGGTCRVPGGDCLQELGASGRLAAALLPGGAGALDLYGVAGGYARAESGGLSLGILGGALPAGGPAACVPEAPPPVGPAGGIPEAPSLRGNTRPDGAPFDFALGFHQHFLDRIGWAAQQAGLLCVDLDTAAVPLLTSDALAVLIPSIVDLLPGGPAPLALAMRPQEPPRFVLGRGTFTESGEIDDPLLTIELPRLQLDFYAGVDQRLVRLFTLETNLALPLALDVNESGQVVPVLGDLDQAFGDIVIKNSQLLAEPPEEIADKVPALLSLAVPLLLDALGPFDLPEVAGLAVRVSDGGFTSVEDGRVLAIFGSLAPATPGKAERVDTVARLAALRAPAAASFRAPRLDRAERPVVELEVDDGRGALEWQVRVDGGVWSPFRRGPRLALSPAAFWLPGRHRIEVRARERGRPETLDAEPAVLEALIDPAPPAVRLAGARGGVRVDATDGVSPRAALRVAYRTDGGAWRAVGAVPALVPAGVEVKVVDEAGNETLASTAGVIVAAEAPRAADRGGCRVAAGARGGSGAALVLLGAVVLAARRRRALRLAALLAACSGRITTWDPDDNGVNSARALVAGRFCDVAAAPGRTIVTAYEEKYGDLVVSEVGPDGETSFVPIDGVPAAPPVDPAAYRGGVVDPGEDVGAWTSVALAAGRGRVAYQDVGRGALKFAVETETGWAAEVVDDAEVGAIGAYASLVLDAAGAPGIAYLAHGLDDGAGGRRAQLRWAERAEPSGAWSVVTVADRAISCAGLCAGGEVCVAASESCAAKGAGCTDCSGDGLACVAGACVAVREAPPPQLLPSGTGLFASAARLPDGRPLIAFYDGQRGDLLLAVRDAGGAWSIQPLDAADDADSGRFASAAVAADGTVHVAYHDATAGRLLHVTWTAAGGAAPPAVVDDGRRDERPHLVGASPALVLDAAGAPVIAYQDAATADLLVARRDAAGAWTRRDLLAGPEGFGFHSAAVLDPDGRIRVATFLYDRGLYPPGDLRIVAP